MSGISEYGGRDEDGKTAVVLWIIYTVGLILVIVVRKFNNYGLKVTVGTCCVMSLYISVEIFGGIL